MIREQLYHLYYSGMDVYDLTPEWLSENKEHFCYRCSRLKLSHSAMDFVTDGKIRKNLDMPFVGHLSIPGVMSFRLFELLGENASEHLNIGSVYNYVAKNDTRQPFVTFVSIHNRANSTFPGYTDALGTLGGGFWKIFGRVSGPDDATPL